MEMTSDMVHKIRNHYINISLRDSQKNKIWIRVTGDCMKPWFIRGDSVSVFSQKKYSVGDMVVLDSDGALLAHRIVHISKDVIITKGDNANILDSKTTKDRIIGLVVAKRDCRGIEYSLVITGTKLVQLGTQISYLSGRLFRKILRTTNPMYRKLLAFVYRIMKRGSAYLFSCAYKTTMRSQQD